MDVDDFIQTKYGYCFYAFEPCVIYNLYTNPEYRGQGRAKRLLQLVIDEIRETGYAGEIEIEASPRENCIPEEALVELYNTFGLKVI